MCLLLQPEGNQTEKNRANQGQLEQVTAIVLKVSVVQEWTETQQHWRKAPELYEKGNTLKTLNTDYTKENFSPAINGMQPLIVWVNETATAANETLLVTWPSAWQKATGVSSFSCVESIGYKDKSKTHSKSASCSLVKKRKLKQWMVP